MLLLRTLRTLLSSRSGVALAALVVVIAAGLLSGPAGLRPAPESAEATSLHEIRKLLASDADASDQFGISAAISGNTAVVGAHGEDAGGDNAGAVYVYRRDQGGADDWGEVKKLTASDAQTEDRFGISVAVSGDTAIVGAHLEDAGGDIIANFGAAYVLQRDHGGADNWGEVKKLTASDTQGRDFFGVSVAVSGDTTVIGARGEDAGGSDAGAAYIFERDQGGADNWGEVTKLTASDAQGGDEFGKSVAVSGGTAVVGAHEEDAGGNDAGAAYVFQREEGGADNWGEVKKLTASDAQTFDNLGITVAVSGDTAFVGARWEDAGGSNAGAAYVFQRDLGGTDNWGEVKKLTASDAQAGDTFGLSVAVSGDTAIVGAAFEDAGGSSAGAAYVFARNEGGADNWGEVTKLTTSDAQAGDRFGKSVAVSGDTAAVGAAFEDAGGNDAGAAYVFNLLLPKPTATETGTPTDTPTPCPDGKVPAASGCGTPTPTHTPTSTGTPTPTPTPCPPGVCPEMSLSASGPVDCGSGFGVPMAKPAKCTAVFIPSDPKVAEFQIFVQGNNLPAIAGYGAELLFGGLTVNLIGSGDCEAHNLMTPEIICVIAFPDAGTVQISTATRAIPLFAPADGTPGDIDLAVFSVRCSDQGAFKVVATDHPLSAFGAQFFAVPFGDPIDVAPTSGQDADSLLINCITPPEAGDTDHDGCSDAQENGTTPGQGGLRNFLYIWDVFDTDTENGLGAGTALTAAVTIGDIFAVAGHFGDTGDPGVDPLSDASGPDYHTRFDRGDIIGANTWNRAPADGAVAITDIFAVAAQFGLDC